MVGVFDDLQSGFVGSLVLSLLLHLQLILNVAYARLNTVDVSLGRFTELAGLVSLRPLAIDQGFFGGHLLKGLHAHGSQPFFEQLV